MQAEESEGPEAGALHRSEELDGLRQQLAQVLAEREASLALIEQRKAQYVLPTDVPPDLTANEKMLRMQRDRLLAHLDAVHSLQPPEPPKAFASCTAELEGRPIARPPHTGPWRPCGPRAGWRLMEAPEAAWQAVTLFAQLQHERYYAVSQDVLCKE